MKFPFVTRKNFEELREELVLSKEKTVFWEKKAASMEIEMAEAMKSMKAIGARLHAVSFLTSSNVSVDTDERVRRLMGQVGMPNSRSLYLAFKQMENELEHKHAPVIRELEKMKSRAMDDGGAQDLGHISKLHNAANHIRDSVKKD